MKKNTAAIILTILITLLIISCNNESPAVTSYRDGGVLYQLDGNDMVASFDENAYPGNNTEIIIMANCKGYPVTSIAPSGFKGKDFITSVSFEDGSNITAIGDEAFKGCSGLTDFEFSTIPALKVIGESAFENCSSFTYAELKYQDLTIGKNAFDGIKNLTVLVPEDMAKTYKSCFPPDSNIYEDINRVEEGVEYLFSKKDKCFVAKAADDIASYNEITIMSQINDYDVKKIADSAFFGIKTLETVNFDEDDPRLEIIGSKAFYNCTSLSSISLPSSLKTIETIFDDEDQGIEGVFANTAISGLDCPNGLKVIPEYCFYGCSKLHTVNLNKVQTIGNSAFTNTDSLTLLIIPASVNAIDEYAFQNENKGGLETLGFLGPELPHIENKAFESFRQMQIYVKSDLIESVEKMEGKFGAKFEVSDIDETVYGDKNIEY